MDRYQLETSGRVSRSIEVNITLIPGGCAYQLSQGEISGPWMRGTQSVKGTLQSVLHKMAKTRRVVKIDKKGERK